MEEKIQFESRLERFEKKGGEYYMVVPDEVATIFVTGRKPARMRCLLNGHVSFQCAIRPRGGGGFYINVGTPLRQQGKLVLGQKLTAEVWKDDSEFGRDLPVELQELFEIDPKGKALFDALLPSHQRGIIHYVADAKSEQVRIDRAIKMINRLAVDGRK